MGNVDSAVRWTIAVAAFALAAMSSSTPLLSLGFAVVGLVMVATAVTRVCPLYRLLGMDTCHRRPTPHG